MITDIKCCIIKVFQYTLFSDAKSQTTGRKYVPRCRRSFDKAKYVSIHGNLLEKPVLGFADQV